MSNESRLKVPVPRRMYLWSLNESSGEVITHIGPTEFTPSANDRVVVSDMLGGFSKPVTGATGARPFVVARDGEYVVLRNPLMDKSEAQPNGTFVAGPNKEKDLVLGSARIIPGPCGFPVWPGQSVEVREAHKLDANQYLLVEVVGPVDEQAPYAQLIYESVGLGSAVIDPSEGGVGDESAEGDATPAAPAVQQLQLGQRIVLQGRRTKLFIPPSGIEVVPHIEEMVKGHTDQGDGVDSLKPNVAEECAKLIAKVKAGMTNKQFSWVKNELRHRIDLTTGERAIILSALDDVFSAQKAERAGRKSSLESGAKGAVDPYARRAVVLGPKSFCFLFDADGNARVVRGPARVFPGPYDTFMRRGSRRRAYDAYELAEHQALWLRIISPISKDDLSSHLPPGYPLDKDHYEAGHELIVQGKPTVFFPFIEAEVLNPSTGEPHVGNDHERVVIEAIGIDQHSGIYVQDRRTGKVKMVRGETSYLVDPRHEEHMLRQIPGEGWNLIIGHSHPHKRTEESKVTTPWALSVTIANNEAVMVTSPAGRRVEVGPQTLLLEYEETLVQLHLSRGASKNGHDLLKTCFLRYQSARVADTFSLLSSDAIQLRIKLGFDGGFDGEPEKWFNFQDPVKLLADAVRARIRAIAKAHTAVELLVSMAKLVTEALMGDGQRLRFAENGMFITTADLLDLTIVDPELSKLFEQARRNAVKLALSDDQARERVASARRQSEAAAEENLILCEEEGRKGALSLAEVENHHKVELLKAQLQFERESFIQAQNQDLEQKAHMHSLKEFSDKGIAQDKRQLAAAMAEVEANSHLHAEELNHASGLAQIRRETAQALAQADATRLAAIQAELVGALHAAADSEVMRAAAENMNLVSLLSGHSPSELLTKLLEGTPLARTPAEMLARTAKKSGGGKGKDKKD